MFNEALTAVLQTQDEDVREASARDLCRIATFHSWSNRSFSMLIRGSHFRAVTTPGHKIQNSLRPIHPGNVAPVKDQSMRLTKALPRVQNASCGIAPST